MKCKRCEREDLNFTVSTFDATVICLACKEIERIHPQYGEALAALTGAVRAGHFLFPGIGLPAECPDAKVIAARKA